MVQRVEGKEVFGSELTLSMDGDNAVTNVSGQLFKGSGNGRLRARERFGRIEPATFSPSMTPASACSMPGWTFWQAWSREAEGTSRRPSGACRTSTPRA